MRVPLAYKKQVRKHFDYWVRALRLQHWKLHLEVVPLLHMPKGPSTRGHCSHCYEAQVATIHVAYMSPTEQSDWGHDFEQTVVHELLHLHFAPLETTLQLPVPAIVYDNVWEVAIEQIARALVRARRGDK
jgi:hypothetical protein